MEMKTHLEIKQMWSFWLLEICSTLYTLLLEISKEFKIIPKSKTFDGNGKTLLAQLKDLTSQ